jgi:hypothetical protein
MSARPTSVLEVGKELLRTHNHQALFALSFMFSTNEVLASSRPDADDSPIKIVTYATRKMKSSSDGQQKMAHRPGVPLKGTTVES